jgi:thiamine-monophosphate kinase
MKERDFVRWVQGQVRRSRDVLVDIGHDAAIVRGSKLAVLKVDNLIEGVHFTSRTPPALIGHKAMARPLSDIAAMAATPRYALLAWAVSRRHAKWLKPIFTAMRKTGERYGVRIVGGDLSAYDGPFLISVSIYGEPGPKTISRTGAQPGDVISVTGPLGGSILGKHLRFQPRFKEARALVRSGGLHAMIDISDGLLIDLDRMCESGGVGATILEGLIPISKDAHLLSRRTRRPAIEHALTDGEDYELLVATTEKVAHRLPFLHPIGEIRPRPGLVMLAHDLEFHKVKPAGWTYEV